MDPSPRLVSPPREVLAAWGAAHAVPLRGGHGNVFASGELVFKPVLDEGESNWLAGALAGVAAPRGFRLARPVPSADGRWVVDGWAACEKLAGAVVGGCWQDACRIADLLHDHLAPIASPPPPRHHPWAIADRFAWGEQELDVPGGFGELAARLESRRRPVDLPDQVIHGDLLGNILFDDRLPPAVIDVSPYWRPARYAKAIVVVDAIGWEGAGPRATTALRDGTRYQLLLRALLFRLGAAIVLVEGDTKRLPGQLAIYERLEGHLSRLSTGWSHGAGNPSLPPHECP